MSRAAVATAVGRQSRSVPLRDNYFSRSERPLNSLLFLLPLIVIYELGTLQYAQATGSPQHIVAFTMMQRFFALFGATGQHLPALAVAGVLFSVHLAGNHPWDFSVKLLTWMAIESLLLAIPLMLLCAVLAIYTRPGLMAVDGPRLIEAVVFPVGAGIYEELVFRLIGFAVLSSLAKDVLGLPQRAVTWVVVAASALLFSSYHYLGNEAFAWPRFGFRVVAGVYLSLLYLSRGFGITAGSHAAYDVMVSLL